MAEKDNVPVTPETEVEHAPLKIISRKEWGGNVRFLKNDYMAGPANSVFLRYFTGHDNCWTEEECKVVVKTIERNHKKKIRNIGFNFLIDRNGTVYEGMGWGKVCQTPDFDVASTNLGFTLSKMINLAFIGNFEEWQISPQMKESVDSLVEYAVLNKFLHPKYEFMKIRRPD